MRRTRSKEFINWTAILNSIAAGGVVSVKRPRHLTITQTRERLEELALRRGMSISAIVILGDLFVEGRVVSIDGLAMNHISGR